MSLSTKNIFIMLNIISVDVADKAENDSRHPVMTSLRGWMSAVGILIPIFVGFIFLPVPDVHKAFPPHFAELS